MERSDGPQTPYEVYCYSCRVTFAAGTRRCVHCGGRLVGARQAATAARAPEMLEVADEAAVEPGLGRRIGGASLWILIALGAALSRMCAEG